MLKGGGSTSCYFEFLGHRDISSTEVYTKIYPTEIRYIIQKMEISWFDVK